MILRFVDRPLVALGVGYILAAGVPTADLYMAELHLSASAPSPLHEISRQTVSSIFSGLALIGFSLIFFGPAYRATGFVLVLIAGATSLGAGVGQMLGLWDWAEYRERRG